MSNSLCSPFSSAVTLFLAALGMSLLDSTTAHSQSVPFVIPGDDGSTSITNFSRLIPAPVSDQFVEVKDGHFFVGDQRLRFWGVNLCFGANFPSHEESIKIAPHFAKLGINAVRFHHMDNQDAPEGIWKTLPDGKRVFDPDQIDKLDFFLNELHKHGIYANLNLHVSRQLTEREGFPVLKNGPWWASNNKWTMYYDSDVQAELKKYCWNLLTHKNPYRGMRRADDPGIALVEMLNENYFSKQGTTLLDQLPQRYVDSFRKSWNRWLTQKYGSTDSMKSNWAKANTKLEEALIKPAAWQKDAGQWTINVPTADYLPTFGHSGPKGNGSSIRFAAPSRSEKSHHHQLSHRRLSVEAGKPYTLSFWVRSDANRRFDYELSTTINGRWRPLGPFTSATANPKWKQYSLVIFPKETVKNQAYIAFSFGADKTPIEFADVRFHAGSETTSIPAGQTLEDLSVGTPKSDWSIAAHNDLKQFMVDTERAWIVELKRFLKDEIGVRVPITASQENYHAEGLLAETVDYVDLHNYWHHPTFPAGKDFNPVEYRTGNDPIESEPTRSQWPANSLLMRTGWRYHGMPFTLSEWNHPEPSDVNTGAVMMAAALGAIQDWDGVFFFDYASNSRRWFADHYEGFFDFNSQPAKLAAFATASNIFLRGDLPPLPTVKNGTFADRLDGRLAFTHRIGVEPSAKDKDKLAIPKNKFFETPNQSLIWDARVPRTAFLRIDTPNTRGVWGLVANQRFDLPGLTLDVGTVARNYATLLATSQDNKPLEQSKSVLLLASSGAENTNMKWNEKRTSVGDQWGTGPTLINPVTAIIGFASDHKDDLKVYSLDGTGKRQMEIKADPTDTGIEFEIGPDHRTLWYEITTE